SSTIVPRSAGHAGPTILPYATLFRSSINDVSVVEGNSGTTNAVLTVSLSSASAQTVTVNYATANGTATAGTDYVSTNGTLTFLTGETHPTITVSVRGDVRRELHETNL